MQKTVKLTQKKFKQLISDAYSHGWHDGQDVIINQVQHIDKGGDDGGDEYFQREFVKPKIGDLYQCWEEGAAYGNILEVCADPFDGTKKLYFYDRCTDIHFPLCYDWVKTLDKINNYEPRK